MWLIIGCPLAPMLVGAPLVWISIVPFAAWCLRALGNWDQMLVHLVDYRCDDRSSLPLCNR